METTTTSLGQFISSHRADLIARCIAKVSRPADFAAADDGSSGIPAFIDQLVVELGHGASMTNQIRDGAAEHGNNLFFRGFTASEVVHVYGSVCQSVTDLAVESTAAFSADDFRTLNRCLDDAIASAVSEYTRQQRIESEGQAMGKNIEMRNLVYAAITAFEALQTGAIGVSGTTGALLHRSLLGLRALL